MNGHYSLQFQTIDQMAPEDAAPMTQDQHGRARIAQQIQAISSRSPTHAPTRKSSTKTGYPLNHWTIDLCSNTAHFITVHRRQQNRLLLQLTSFLRLGTPFGCQDNIQVTHVVVANHH